MTRPSKPALAMAALLLSVCAQAERRIVVFDPSMPQTDRLKLASGVSGSVVRELELIDAVVVEAPASGVSAMETALKQDPRVLRVDEDPKIDWIKSQAPSFSQVPFPDIHPPKFHPAARAARAEQGPEIPWGIKRVGAPAAWAVTKGQGVKVCVIDTGIDYRHPDLKANVKGGWNAIKKTDDYMDDNGHGTHVSGTIAAAGEDGAVAGVAPQAELYGVKVLDDQGSGTFDDVIAGMQWAVQHHMQVASMSLGADQGNESLRQAVAAMAKAGVVLVAAAGNSGSSVGYPAAYPGAIAVAAMDSSDHVAYFSSRGPQVALIAPGVDVKSTYMGGGYQSMDGTSMATPHVSGLAALAIAAHGYAGYDQVLGALKHAARKLKRASSNEQGAGVVDAVKLVD